jgi:hypothetical protein
MLRSWVSMMLGVVMTIAVLHRLQRGMTHICQGESGEQTARNQKQQNPFHKLRQPFPWKSILFLPCGG